MTEPQTINVQEPECWCSNSRAAGSHDLLFSFLEVTIRFLSKRLHVKTDTLPFASSVLAINASLLWIIIQQAIPRSNRMFGPHTVHENKAVVSNLTSAFEYKLNGYFNQYSKRATMWKIRNCSSIPSEVRNSSLEHTPTMPIEHSDRALQAAIYKETKQSTI